MPEADLGSAGFSEFVTGAMPGLLRFGHALTGSPEEAEDLAQKALAKRLRRWRRVSAGDPLGHVSPRHGCAAVYHDETDNGIYRSADPHAR